MAGLSAFRASRPYSIVGLPPLNNSPEVEATYSMYAQMTLLLAEAGYYVLPVALVDETFKRNGLTTAADIHAVGVQKLHDIFGADTALYVMAKDYGSGYTIVNSAITVTANAKLVDLKTGALLWSGTASANSNENSQSGNGWMGILLTAVVSQVINSGAEAAHPTAALTSRRLLQGGTRNGLLYGPRSPDYVNE